MNKKFGFLLSIMSFGLILISEASAANYGSSFQNALKPILDLFGGLFGLMKSQTYAIIVMKVILWIVALNLFLIAIRKTSFWGDNPTQQKSAKIIATLLSLGGIMVIPEKTIQGLFFYVGVLFIIGILFVIINMIRSFVAKGETTIGGWLGIGIGVFIIIAGILLMAFPPYNTQKIFFDLTLFDLIFLAGIIIIIYGIITLAGGGGSGGGHGGGHTTTPTPAPVVPPNPAAPNDAEIRRLQGEIGSLGADLTALAADVSAFNTLVTGQPGAPAPYPGTAATAPRSTISTQATHIISEVRRIRGIAHNIQTNSQFMNVPAADRTAFAGHVTNLTTLYARFMADYTDALLRW